MNHTKADSGIPWATFLRKICQSSATPGLLKNIAGPSWRAFRNLGNHRSEKLTDFIAEIEKALGKKAQMIMAEMQPGDVPTTYADIEASTRDLGFKPTTPISVGLPKFVAWFREYYRV
jgi:nucleoside-diphosphate-sugar epimerase